MSKRLFLLVFKTTLLIMAITGAAQMPIFKRYYVSDAPGLGWLADFYLTNKVHYLFGALLVFMAVYLATQFVMKIKGEYRLTPSGMLRAGLYCAVIATGILRVIKNLHNVTLDPYTVMLIDWTHLGFAVLLGIAAVYAFFKGRIPYLEDEPYALRHMPDRI